MFANVVIQINPFTAAFCQHSSVRFPPRHSISKPQVAASMKMGSFGNKFKTLSTVEEEEEDGSTINNNFYDVYGPQVYFLFIFPIFI